MALIPIADFSAPAARRQLATSDPVMARILRTHGPCTLSVERSGSPYAALFKAIIHQQLHARAAASIQARVQALVGGTRLPLPAELATLPDAALRGAGLSVNKLAALRDLAAKALDGTLPSAHAVRHLSNEDLITRCTQVRGVGRWTVEMLLIFRLGRPDVLPADDYGVRNGYRLAYSLEEMPTPKALTAIGARWAPWRSMAAWYLWRVADAGKIARVPRKKA